MKLSSIWARYKEYTKELTSAFRTLGLGAAAICWFFKTPEVTFPPIINFALLLVVIFFLLDISHYSVGAIVVRRWAESKERELQAENVVLDENTEVKQPVNLDVWPTRLFVAKGLVLFLAFCLIGYELASRAC